MKDQGSRMKIEKENSEMYTSRSFEVSEASLCGKPQACGFSAPERFQVFHCCAKTELWHVAVKHLELIWLDEIGFMPNTYSSIRANCLVELLPRRDALRE